MAGHILGSHWAEYCRGHCQVWGFPSSLLAMFGVLHIGDPNHHPQVVNMNPHRIRCPPSRVRTKIPRPHTFCSARRICFQVHSRQPGKSLMQNRGKRSLVTHSGSLEALACLWPVFLFIFSDGKSEAPSRSRSGATRSRGRCSSRAFSPAKASTSSRPCRPPERLPQAAGECFQSRGAESCFWVLLFLWAEPGRNWGGSSG